jgi:chitinase
LCADFCYIEEIRGHSTHSKKYCSKAYTKYYPCNPNKRYYGRGPIQLTWNFNYGPAGKSIGFDGLNSPETIANDPVISFKTALWYWMKNVHPILHQGFGATIKATNYFECNGAYPARVKGRVSRYTEYCHQLTWCCSCMATISLASVTQFISTAFFLFSPNLSLVFCWDWYPKFQSIEC